MTRQNPGLNLKEFLPYRLSIVTNRISASFARLYSEKFNLSIPEWRVMAVLGQQPGLSADEVCSETEMDKVPVSRAVTKLLDKGLLNREFSGTGPAPFYPVIVRGWLRHVYADRPAGACLRGGIESGVLTAGEQSQLEKLLDKLMGGHRQ